MSVYEEALLNSVDRLTELDMLIKKENLLEKLPLFLDMAKNNSEEFVSRFLTTSVLTELTGEVDPVIVGRLAENLIQLKFQIPRDQKEYDKLQAIYQKENVKHSSTNTKQNAELYNKISQMYKQISVITMEKASGTREIEPIFHVPSLGETINKINELLNSFKLKVEQAIDFLKKIVNDPIEKAKRGSNSWRLKTAKESLNQMNNPQVISVAAVGFSGNILVDEPTKENASRLDVFKAIHQLCRSISATICEFNDINMVDFISNLATGIMGSLMGFDFKLIASTGAMLALVGAPSTAIPTVVTAGGLSLVGWAVIGIFAVVILAVAALGFSLLRNKKKQVIVADYCYIFGCNSSNNPDISIFGCSQSTEQELINYLIEDSKKFLERGGKSYQRVIGFSIDSQNPLNPAIVVDLSSSPKIITIDEIKKQFATIFMPIFLSDNIFLEDFVIPTQSIPVI